MLLVSVICIVRNGERFIRETVESIQKQTFSNWEMILVDVGSDDNTVSILQALGEQDGRLHLIETKGVGRGRALNIATEHAKGSYIAHIDADAPAHPERLARQYELLEKRKDIACLVSQVMIMQEDEEVEWPSEMGTEELTPITAKMLFKRNPINHSSLFIRKSTLQKIGGYDEARELLFDYELWLRLVTRGHLIYESSEKLTKRLYDGQSYKKRKRLRYLMATRKLKRSFIQQITPKYKYSILANASVLYGLLPQMLKK